MCASHACDGGMVELSKDCGIAKADGIHQMTTGLEDALRVRLSKSLILFHTKKTTKKTKTKKLLYYLKCSPKEIFSIP